jgi:hypothetical protein
MAAAIPPKNRRRESGYLTFIDSPWRCVCSKKITRSGHYPASRRWTRLTETDPSPTAERPA